MTINVLALTRLPNQKGSDAPFMIGSNIPYWDEYDLAYDFAYRNRIYPVVVYESYSLEDALDRFGSSLIHYDDLRSQL